MEKYIQIEFMSLPLEDLQDYCAKLFECYRQLRDDAEADAQLIHELKRKLETAYAAENYMSQEIEELMQTLASIKKENTEKKKVQTELEDLQQKHHTLTTDYTTLQQDYAVLNAENVEMRKQTETVKSAKRSSTLSMVDSGAEELTKRIALLEAENCSLIQKLEAFQESLVQQTLALTERESNIEVLRDQVTCLQEIFRSKCEELDEKTSLLEGTQEHLAEANTRLAMLETKPEGVDQKCYSLFAEVDDQRQAMKKLLVARKKSFIQMKKKCNEGQSEIKRLKREKNEIYAGLKEHYSICCAYRGKLKDRIYCLEKQLEVSQKDLRDLVNGLTFGWLESMLCFCIFELPQKVVNYVTCFTTEALKLFRYSRAFCIMQKVIPL